MASFSSINSWRLAGLVSAAVLAGVFGCKSAKEGPTTQRIVEDSIGAETVRPVWAEAAAEGRVPDGWLKTFNDPKMEALVVEALQNNMALRAASSRVDAAAAAAVVAGARKKPVVAAGGGAGAGVVSGGDDVGGGGVGLNVSWEVDVWGRLDSIQTAAEEQLAAVQAQFEFARQSLAAQTAKAWYLASETQQLLVLSNETVGIYSQIADIVQAKVNQGQVTPQDLNLAKADFAAAQERARSAEQAHKEAVRSLELLLGRYPSAELEVAEQFVPVPPPIPAGIPSDVLDRRPDLIAAEATARAAFQNVQVAKLAKLPQVALTAGGGAASSELSDALGLGSGFFGAGANFLAPVYTGGRLEAEIEIATANQEQALANFGQTALVAFKEVEEALLGEKLLAERELLLQTAVAENEEALRIAKVRYDTGAVSMLDVLQMQARTDLARTALIDMKSRRLAQRIDLHLALGGSFEVPPTTQPATQPEGARPVQTAQGGQ